MGYNVSLRCFCGRNGSIPMLSMAETRDLSCSSCGATLRIWRADGPIGQLRYRSDRTFISHAPVPFERLTDTPSSELRNGGSAVGVLSPRIIRDIGKLREIVTAGQCELTLVFIPKGQTESVRVTYRIGLVSAAYAARHGIARIYQVKVVDSNRLTRQSPILGSIGADGVFQRASRVDPAMVKHLKVFERFYNGVGTKEHPGAWTEIPSSLEIWRGERCVRCFHRLTDPDSIHSGWGSHCARQAGIIRLKAPLASEAMGEGAQVYRDLMIDVGSTDPSDPIVLRVALQRLDEGGERGALARLAVEHACKVLGMDETQLREACSLDPDDGSNDEIADEIADE